MMTEEQFKARPWKYWANLIEGNEFEDFVAMGFQRRGIPLVALKSKRAGYDVGENLMGLEIKLDRKRLKSGNLFLETAEVAYLGDGERIDSGILRMDNSWLYGVGDYERFWVFNKRQLQSLYRRMMAAPDQTLWEDKSKNLFQCRLHEWDGQKEGMLMREEWAGEWAAKIVIWDKMDHDCWQAAKRIDHE